MTRLLTISGLAFLCGLVAVAGAQEPRQFAFSFDTAESGYEGAGHAAADLDIVIDGNQLTAILRNTSPDAENFGSLRASSLARHSAKRCCRTLRG